MEKPMDLETLRESGRIIYEVVSGSHAYGTATPKSDRDLRGFYLNPCSEYLGLDEPPGEVSDDRHNTVYYSLKKAFCLLMTANPNMIELLWMPEDCIIHRSPLMEELIAHRGLFISKKCFYTHSGYAFDQISRAKGQNKMINHPELAGKPRKEDYCWVIPAGKMLSGTPMRPVPYSRQTGDHIIDLRACHCSSLEHVGNIFRLYHYGEQARGVFRGDGTLTCEAIPLDDEERRFCGILIYNHQDYVRALNEHRKYSEWMKKRNEERWIDQEKGVLTYDQKNMMHCMRLLLSGESILRTGEPIVRFEGEQREYLMRIRRGEFAYEEIMEAVDEKMRELESLCRISTIPDSVEPGRIDILYRELTS